MKIGEEYILEKVVEPTHLASKWQSGNVDVFATPFMIGFMEQACLNLVQKYLPEGHTTVGASVNVEHIRPSVAGQKLRFISRLEGMEGRKLDFSVEAYNVDDNVMIGCGKHSRAIIDLERFYAKLNAKL